VVSLDQHGVASYTFHFAETANFGWQPDDLPELGADDWLHIASLACVVSPGAEVLLDWASRTRAGISFDINVRPTVITDPEVYWEKVKPWLRVVGRRGGIVKASDEDVKFLTQAGAPSDDPVEIAGRWVEKYGLGLAVLTLGPGGGLAVGPGGEQTMVAGFPTVVADTVGAGDTFMAGFLEGYINRGQSIEAALTRGAAAASIVCSRQGAQPPTTAETEALMATRGDLGLTPAVQRASDWQVSG
jgi:fructokinase